MKKVGIWLLCIFIANAIFTCLGSVMYVGGLLYVLIYGVAILAAVYLCKMVISDNTEPEKKVYDPLAAPEKKPGTVSRVVAVISSALCVMLLVAVVFLWFAYSNAQEEINVSHTKITELAETVEKQYALRDHMSSTIPAQHVISKFSKSNMSGNNSLYSRMGQNMGQAFACWR